MAQRASNDVLSLAERPDCHREPPDEKRLWMGELAAAWLVLLRCLTTVIDSLTNKPAPPVPHQTEPVQFQHKVRDDDRGLVITACCHQPPPPISAMMISHAAGAVVQSSARASAPAARAASRSSASDWHHVRVPARPGIAAAFPPGRRSRAVPSVTSPCELSTGQQARKNACNGREESKRPAMCARLRSALTIIRSRLWRPFDGEQPAAVAVLQGASLSDFPEVLVPGVPLR